VALQWVRTAAAHGDLVNGYREPTQLGVDRWVGSIGAHRWLPGETLLIVTAGTATTLDIVTATPDGARFEGGLILPGLALMLGTLARNTAQLPELDVLDTGAVPRARCGRWAQTTLAMRLPPAAWPRQAGAIERSWRALGERGPVRCLLSGRRAPRGGGALAMPFEMR
jgi:type III pantothenate kinase